MTFKVARSNRDYIIRELMEAVRELKGDKPLDAGTSFDVRELADSIDGLCDSEGEDEDEKGASDSDNIQAELVNLGNGLALSGDGLSASICQQAIVQINCLTADNRLLTAENRALVTKVQQAERDKARVVGLMDSYIVAGEPLADVMEREEYRIRLAHDQEQTIATLTAWRGT